MTLQEHIEKVLDQIINPTLDGGLIASNTVRGLHVDDQGKVAFVLEFPAPEAQLGMKIREQAIKALESVPGVTDISAVLTADKKPRPKAPPREKMPIQGVKHIVLVGSGKGGVGKSTTAVNLACALSELNLNVGIVDADVYGPSLPRMLGVNRQPKSVGKDMMKPIVHAGIQCMSMGFLMAESLPAIWRGPMVHGALRQMMRQVAWEDVDVLVVDLPPGTGDIPISLIQNYFISGAVIVSTPQDIALIDARKAANMLTRMETPILGVVENMSYFHCPHCHERTDIFHHGGAKQDAAELGVPFLGEIPLNGELRQASDAGQPLVLNNPDALISQAYMEIASKLKPSFTG